MDGQPESDKSQDKDASSVENTFGTLINLETKLESSSNSLDTKQESSESGLGSSEYTNNSHTKQDPLATSLHTKQDTFKKPILIGKIGRLPRKVMNITKKDNAESENRTIVEPEQLETNNSDVQESSDEQMFAVPLPKKPILIGPKISAQLLHEASVPLPYQEPPWSGPPHALGKNYSFEVLKSGSIIEEIELMDKPFWVFGRSTLADLYMAHPTVSRYHAILQYRAEATADEPVGYYLYDLASTHGTFLNKCKLKPRVYARVQVGHMVKLGCSTRSYILTGPDEDAEDESQLTVTELQQQRIMELTKRAQVAKETEEKEQAEQAERLKKEEEQGIDWGLGDDADEQMDLAVNPYAQTNNEELYIDDPKKALRGFMEREGFDLEYDCTEQGFGQFLCKVELPVDDDNGRPVVAEVLHKGKKKEAVVQCALEACRILDRYGVLRQATHESRKRKPRNWEENDYYDSDEDTFLDRTGTIEKKREKRKQAAKPQQAETYESLTAKEKEVSEQIRNIEKRLNETTNANNSNTSNSDTDSLDSFMSELQQAKPDKQAIRRLKIEHSQLKAEHAHVIKLANIAKPANMPALVSWEQKKKGAEDTFAGSEKRNVMPMFGKRLKVKVQVPGNSNTLAESTMCADEGEEMKDEVEPTIKKDKTNNTVFDVSNSDNKNGSTPEKHNKERTELCSKSESDCQDADETEEEKERRRKRNQKRIQQRREKAEIEKKKAYERDSYREGYDMWVPPSGQTGDGRTKLNEKFGY